MKRLGMEGALTGLWLAKRFVRHGGALGKVACASAALGTVGSLGLLAHRIWKNRQSYRNAKDSLSATPQEEGRLSLERTRGIAQGSILPPLYSNI
ncbi:MAG: hypothetical protein HXX08_17145 [Chloroflexi bacterium]|uniref:Uncharacterized protein n=1 Tax=Candidatus Chlorohelix allophototropha TaxID=3003348 RepID=A0A8T7M658_9CHLR|nr:hypothetical protein [Chloroflexota bacterium]WJW69495.1 hypothetical protein OZ401_003112 [Chloroflexota bacterium L227-S17]